MRTQTVFILVLALVCGVAAVVVVNQLLTSEPPAPVEAGAPATAKVVVAARDVPRGNLLTREDVREQSVPEGQELPEGVATSIDQVVDRRALVQLSDKEFILDGKLGARGARGGLATLIPEGMQAFTIQSPDLAASGGGFILPENHVDVWLTTSGGGDDSADTTLPLLKDIEVLAVNQQLDAPGDNTLEANKNNTVTLMVTPDQAATLVQSQARGVLHLSLRSNGNEEVTKNVLPTPNVAAKVPKGKRAVTFQAAEPSAGVGGIIVPQSHVDVLFVGDVVDSDGSKDSDDSNKPKFLTIPLLQDVEVLAVDQLLDSPDNGMVDPNRKRTFTLLVTPEQSALFAYAKGRGEFHLTLRSPGDDSVVTLPPAPPKIVTDEWVIVTARGPHRDNEKITRKREVKTEQLPEIHLAN